MSQWQVFKFPAFFDCLQVRPQCNTNNMKFTKQNFSAEKYQRNPKSAEANGAIFLLIPVLGEM